MYCRCSLLITSAPLIESGLLTVEYKEVPSKLVPSSPVQSPISRANTATTSSLARRLLIVIALNVCIYKMYPRCWSLMLSFSAAQAFNDTAIVFGIISSSPLAFRDHRDSIDGEQSPCQIIVSGTSVIQVLNLMPAFGSPAYLICLQE